MADAIFVDFFMFVFVSSFKLLCSKRSVGRVRRVICSRDFNKNERYFTTKDVGVAFWIIINEIILQRDVGLAF